jgi:hypothetical protein
MRVNPCCAHNGLIRAGELYFSHFTEHEFSHSLVKTRIAIQQPNVSFHQLRTSRRICSGPLCADFVAKVGAEQLASKSEHVKLPAVLSNHERAARCYDAPHR